MNGTTLGERFIDWATTEPSARGLILIGSQARGESALDASDRYSDWDFQVITSESDRFAAPAWLGASKLGEPVTYAIRFGRLGSARKVTALFHEGELDLVILPAVQLRWLKIIRRLGLRSPAAQRGMDDLGSVLAGGYRILKGEREYGRLWSEVAQVGREKRLSDDECRDLANGIVCDYVSTLRKIDRGEMIAAQRWLHHQLTETNFKLLREVRRRAGDTAFHDARRLEMHCRPDEVMAVTVAALPNSESLRAAVEHSRGACVDLMKKLMSDAWRWPPSIA